MEAAGKVWLHWSKCHQDTLAEQNKTNNQKNLFQSLNMAFLYNRDPLGLHAPRLGSLITLLTNRFGQIELRPKTTWLRAATFHSPGSTCDWRVFVFLTLSLGVCLPDTCLAWPTFVLIPSVSVRTCEGRLPHLAVWISASSVPVSAVRDWLKPTQAPVFALGATGQRQHFSLVQQTASLERP